MLYIIIKNNFKLMFRNKMILVMMTLLPILVIAALSSAFHGLLDSQDNTEDMVIGYYLEEGSPLKICEEQFLDAIETQGIRVQSYKENDMENAIKSGKVEVFIYSGTAGCEIAAKDKDSVQTRICAYAVQQFVESYEVAFTGTEIPAISSGSLPYTKTAEAGDYYGIIEIIYFLWCGLIFLTAVVQSERKNKLQKRYAIAPASRITLYLGKLIPCEILCVVCSAITAVISTLLFDIHWGNIPGAIGILLLVSLAANTFGIFLLYLVNNTAVSVILLFGTVWTAGFIGGSFETYMYSTWSEGVKCLSPLYFANRTVVEYSTMGHSDYTVGCICYMIGITLVCAVLGTLLMNRRMEE